MAETNRSDDKSKHTSGSINWKKVRRRFKKKSRKFLGALGMGVVFCGKKLGQLAKRTVPFWKKLGDGLCAGGRRLHEKIQGTKAAPVCNAIVRFFAAMGRGCKALNARFKTLGKPLRLGISAASLLLVVGLVLSAALSGGSQKTAQTDLPIEVQGSPSPTPVPETTALPSQEPVVQAAVAGTVQDTPAAFSETYKKGDDGAIIADVQLRLMELGYMDSDEPTEHFGSITEEALTSFQKHNDLPADGVLREATYLALMSETAKEYVMQDGDEGDDVRDVQQRLYELGYLAKNCITGTFGDKTLEALKDFQSSNGLKGDGKAGVKTLEKLYDEDVVGNFYRKGDVNDSIKTYQQKLVKLGYLSSTYSPKGKMDNETVAALKSFQNVNGIIADGCLGVVTMELLDSKNAVAYSLSLGMKGSDVKDVQKRLYKLGYLKHSSQITGYFSAETEDAVEAFQKRNGLTADGTVGAKTLKVLESDSAKKPKATATPKPTKTPKPTSASTSKLDKFIQIAKSKVGSPYVRGAKGPNKFDCSGFVYWCLNQAGVKQGYMTSITWRSCTKYTRFDSMSQAQKGDVLVFKGSSMSTGHVGIYLGGGKMVDASSGAGQVRITSSNILTSTYWKTHFLMGYHIFD